MKESVIDRVKSDLIKKIVSGEMAIGDAVLSERKLSDKYCVSYMTARKAVFELVEEGYLRKESTRGTFVANRWGGKNLSDCPVKPIIMLIMSDLISHLSHRTIGWLERIARKNNFQLMVCNSELNVTCEAMHLEQAMLMSVAGEISAVYDVDPGKFQEVVRRSKNSSGIHDCRSFEELADSPCVDVIIIASPNYVHAEQVEYAANPEEGEEQESEFGILKKNSH